MMNMLLAAEGHPLIPSLFSGLYTKMYDSLPTFMQDKAYGYLWWDSFIIGGFAILILGTMALLTSRKLEKIPTSRLQNLWEAVVGGIEGMMMGMIGPHGAKYLPIIGTLFCYIFMMNLFGLVAGFRAPTMLMSVTLAMGLFTFVAVQYCGMKSNGVVGHMKHFTGPDTGLHPAAAIPMALLFIGVEVVGELVKPLSLALRLRNNIYGEDMVIENLMFLAHDMLGGPIPLQLPMMMFAVFTSFLQAFIFSSLACIYISVVTHHEAEHHGEAHH
jgi:F-type H+-transporting ATPase subunit a